MQGPRLVLVGLKRVAPSKESLVNALMCSLETSEANSQEITRHTSTCKRYPSIHSFYTAMHRSDVRSGRNGSESEIEPV